MQTNCIIPNPDFEEQRFDGETVLIKKGGDSLKEPIIYLNELASYIWREITIKPLNLHQLQEKVTSHYSVSADEAIDDLQAFIDKAKELQIVLLEKN